MGKAGIKADTVIYGDGQLRNAPVWSAAHRQPSRYKTLLIIIAVTGFLTILITMPRLIFVTVTGALTVIICIMATLRLLGCIIALRRTPRIYPDPDIWPFYTVLVPMRDEAHMVPRLMDGLAALDYPAARLEIMMISEANDSDTTAAVMSRLRPPFKSVVVPVSLPATKPKALNVAMKTAKGDIITIYDAEDRPHPGQLKAAARALHADPKLGGVQAPLSYYNSAQNWLTRQFTLEYDALFRVWNPLLTAIGLPFPLGGTSNHVTRKALDTAGRWDPHNVTEDADLSFRLAAYGYALGCIDPPTGEEALSDYDNWKKQRMRWQKGYIQTWTVHMRQLRGFGKARFIALQVTIGATLLASFLHPLAIVGMAVVWAFWAAGILPVPPHPIYFALMVFGYGAALTCAAMGAYIAGRKYLWRSLIWMPAYWVMLFWPSVLAAIEFVRAPFYWHKTGHGHAKLDQNMPGYIDECRPARHVNAYGQSDTS